MKKILVFTLWDNPKCKNKASLLVVLSYGFFLGLQLLECFNLIINEKKIFS